MCIRDSYSSVDDCIADRPRSLTSERAESFLPSMCICDEWQRKMAAGELPDGPLGMAGNGGIQLARIEANRRRVAMDDCIE